MKALMPPNSTVLEKNLAEVGQDAFDLASIKVIRDIPTVPAQFLSFIAYQNSVDYWDENWQDSLKRKVIQDSKSQHKLKGTVEAIRRALEPFGYEVKIIEWFQIEPNLVPGTFHLELDLIGKSLTEEVYNEVNRLVSDAKAASRHMTNLIITTNPILTIRNIFVHQTANTFTCEPQS